MIKRYRRTAVSQYIFVGLILIALLIFGYLSTLVMKSVPFVDHFALPWAAGRSWLLEGENPYDPVVSQMAEDAIADANYSGQLPEQGILVHPIINLFFFLPFSLIPYPISRAIWVIILTLCAGLLVHFSLKFSEWELSKIEKFAFITLLVIWYPGLYTILTGRLTVVLVFTSLLGLLFLKSGKYTAAGFLLALTAGSLPLTFLVIVLAILWSISRRQWSFLIALFSGIAFLLIISFLMLPSWPLDWLRTLLGTYQDFTWVQTPIMTLATFLPGIANFLSLTFHGLIGIYVLVLFINLFRKSDRVLMWNALAMLVIAFLLHVRFSIPELYLVIPPLLLVFRYFSERWSLAGKIAICIAVILVSAGSWILVLPDVRFTESISITPLTIGLPLFVFISMLWIRWWAVKLTRLQRI